jgi:hypothetical protein
MHGEWEKGVHSSLTFEKVCVVNSVKHSNRRALNHIACSQMVVRMPRSSVLSLVTGLEDR